jgi:ABC-type Na+ efflux pump permease subunit
MTFVGKILVIVIMAFALLFLGISTVVFTTATNWKIETEKQRAEVRKQQGKNRDLGEKVKAAENELAAAKKSHELAKKELDNRIAALEADTKRLDGELTQSRTALETAQQNAKSALEEAASRKAETDLLREQKSAVEKQANEYKIRQTELYDQIRILTRERDVAKKHNEDLRDRVAKFSTLLRQKGLSDDISQVKGLESPPVVHGEVLRVDAQNTRVELSIGSDDGLVPGHELYLYRVKPRPQFLGKITVISTDPDQAVGRVIGTTINGMKIQEGDLVSSTIRPRS